jgi:tRNA(Ile)-lysidine synthase
VHTLGERLLAHIRRQELLRPGDRLGVAVSGGIDSVALLRLLLELRHELGIVLSVVHFNHKLRGAESDADREFAADLARQHDLEFHTHSEDVAQHAAQERISIEAAARELRYGFFRRLLGEDQETNPQGLKPSSAVVPDGTAKAVPFHKPPSFESSVETLGHSITSHLTKVATGHTLDDQAETVLMRLIRGTGLRGLGGIYPQIAVEDCSGDLCGEIIRPLLAIRRRELEQYLHEINQPWCEDSTNAEDHFTRNRVRKLVLPLLEREFNSHVAENLAELSEIARGEEDYWENEVSGWLGTTVNLPEPNAADTIESVQPLTQIQSPTSQAAYYPPVTADASVNRLWLAGEPLAVQRRALKAIGEELGIALEFHHIEDLRRFAMQDRVSGKELSLPLGWKAFCDPDSLIFVVPGAGAPDATCEKHAIEDYQYDLAIPGRVIVPEAESVIEAVLISHERAEYNPDHLLDPQLLQAPLTLRNWRPGDRFWPIHTKSPKKIKELLQERHIAQPERRLWPVLVKGNEIVWVRGFPSSAKHRCRPGADALLIREMPLAPGRKQQLNVR